MQNDDKVDLTSSKLEIELKDEKEIEKVESEINANIKGADSEKNDRKRMYDKRRDFVAGRQEKYTNIVGLTQKSKQGHADQVVNYVGRSAVKIYHSVANNPPHIKGLPLSRTNQIEGLRAQSVEDFVDRVFWRNKWWKQGYKRAVMNQVVIGDFGIKVYFDSSKKEIKITQAEKVENLVVGWRSDDALEYDWVAHTSMMSIEFIQKEWGIKVKPEMDPKSGSGAGSHGDEYGTNAGSSVNSPSEQKDYPTQPMAAVTEYTTDELYIIMIGGKMCEYVKHEWGFNPWVIGHSLHMPGKTWSKSYIDDLMSPNIELNEASNDERDYIRTASNAKYTARNMSDFDPESIKPGSGQVIFIDGPDSDFSTLQQTVNTYPVDTYVARTKSYIHDMLVPEVGFGSSGSDSGRKSAIDYQTILDVTNDLRDAWELVLEGIIERIQILGNKYFPKVDFWKNAETGEFEIRMIDFDWDDVMPISTSDKIVNVLNKFQMGLPFETTFEELGYKDPRAMIELMKQEAEDKILVEYRAKLYTMMKGGLEAQADAAAAAQENAAAATANATTPGAPQVNSPSPILVPSENQGGLKPMSAKGGTTSYTSGAGLIAKGAQNLGAQQGGV
jgi:hypothetical protein